MLISEKKKNIYKIFAWVLVLALLLPLCQAYAAGGTNSLTIYRYDKGSEIHDINKKPTGGDPVSGSVFKLWKISEDSKGLSPEEYTKKIDELQKLSDAELDSNYPDPKISDPTDNEGKVTISQLDDGLYYVREIEKGKGQIVPFLVNLPLETDKGLEKDVSVYPKKITPPTPPPPPHNPPGEFELLKTDMEGKALAGAHFRLYKKNGSTLDPVPLKKVGDHYVYDISGRDDLDLISDDKGLIRVKDLAEGTYVVRETQAPEGYEPTAKDFTINVLSGKKASLTVKNKPNETGGFRFQKIAADGKKTPLKGAKFALYVKTAKGWELVKRDGKDLVLESGKDGFFEVKGLPFGEYALYEIERPAGYEFTDRHYYFTVDAKSYDQGKFITIENEKTPPPPPDKPPTPPPSRPPTPPPRTGDDGIRTYIIIGAAALLGIIVLRPRKSKSDKDADNGEV